MDWTMSLEERHRTFPATANTHLQAAVSNSAKDPFSIRTTQPVDALLLFHQYPIWILGKLL
jgi:hypothetical protein